MASYHLSVHPNVSRGRGQSLVRAAAYNARARLTDDRTGAVWDYRHYGGLLAEGIYAATAPEWARDLGRLVNEVERSEKRGDAQLAMNLDIALPFEHTLEQNRRLIQDFVREQFMRRGYAAHVAIHAPDPGGDPRNIHAHVLVTLRRIGPEGFAATKAEQQERYRNRSAYVEQLREKWEKLANRHLARNGIAARIDRRSLKERGIGREPQQHRGPAVTAMQRRGKATRIGVEIEPRQAELAAARSPQPEIAAPAAAERAAEAAQPAPPEFSGEIAAREDQQRDRGPDRERGQRYRQGHGIAQQEPDDRRSDQAVLPRSTQGRAAPRRRSAAAGNTAAAWRDRRRIPQAGAERRAPLRCAPQLQGTGLDHQPLYHDPGGRLRNGDRVSVRAATPAMSCSRRSA